MSTATFHNRKVVAELKRHWQILQYYKTVPFHNRKVVAELKQGGTLSQLPPLFSTFHNRKVVAELKHILDRSNKNSKQAFHNRKVVAELKHDHPFVLIKQRHLSTIERLWPN